MFGRLNPNRHIIHRLHFDLGWGFWVHNNDFIAARDYIVQLDLSGAHIIPHQSDLLGKIDSFVDSGRQTVSIFHSLNLLHDLHFLGKFSIHEIHRVRFGRNRPCQIGIDHTTICATLYALLIHASIVLCFGKLIQKAKTFSSRFLI